MAPETDITCEMIPNRAGYGGKTRRTGKIHWQECPVPGDPKCGLPCALLCLASAAWKLAIGAGAIAGARTIGARCLLQY